MSQYVPDISKMAQHNAGIGAMGDLTFVAEVIIVERADTREFLTLKGESLGIVRASDLGRALSASTAHNTSSTYKQAPKMTTETEYSHVQFSGVMPTKIAKIAVELLKIGVENRPQDCGSVMRIQPHQLGKSDPAARDGNGIVIDTASLLAELKSDGDPFLTGGPAPEAP